MQLSEINIYPVKSLAGIALNEAVVEDRGLQFDRRWMLIDPKNRFITQREYPKMAAIGVEVGDESLTFVTGSDRLTIPFDAGSTDTTGVKIWESRTKGIIYDEAVNRWFAERLETDCRLVIMPETVKRKVNPFFAVRKFRDVVSFADGYPVLLIGQSSLDDLNEKLAKPLPMNRFRPNLVVTGAGPFAEDTWKKIKVGDVVFHLVKPCARCVITTIDQNAGILDGKEPLKTLATYRLRKTRTGQGIMFGQNLIAENFGATVKIGDNVEILETR